MELIKRIRIVNLTFVVVFTSVLTFFNFPSSAQTFYQKKKNGVIYITNIPPKEKGYKPLRIPWQTIGVSRHRSPGSFRYSNNFDYHINERASNSGIDPRLIKAIIKVESNFNPRAVSPKGAMGLMQLMPETARRNGVGDPYDPAENIRGGVKYFKKLTRMFKGDLRLALAGYNAGEEAVVEYGYRIPPYQETINYVDKVLAHYNHLKNGKAGRGEMSVKFESKPVIGDVSTTGEGGNSSKDEKAKMKELSGTDADKKNHLSTSEGVYLGNDNLEIANKSQIARNPSNEICLPSLIDFQPIPEFLLTKAMGNGTHSTAGQACNFSSY
ncbi:MAG: lytic transglycosylase domain-containing protein [Thermodesulfobacteriota bacterium]